VAGLTKNKTMPSSWGLAKMEKAITLELIYVIKINDSGEKLYSLIIFDPFWFQNFKTNYLQRFKLQEN
jgi:hypothetical protein